jgi:hypothetical protein
MQNAESLSHEQVREFLRSSREVEFAGCRRAEIYAWVERTLVAQRYGSLGKPARGLIREGVYVRRQSPPLRARHAREAAWPRRERVVQRSSAAVQG